MQKYIVLFALFLSQVSLADINDINIDQSFVRAAIQQQRNSAAFMSITNNSDTQIALIKAESPVAKIVELHTHINDNGIMRMRQITQIDLPAKKMVVLKPGGLHIMLLGLNHDLKAGDQVDVTLTFSDNSQKTITLPVKNMMRHKMMKHKKSNM